MTAAFAAFPHYFVTSLLELPQWAIVLIIAAACAIEGELLRWLFEWLGDRPQLRARTTEQSHIVGYVFSVCGVLYAVVLAFVVVTAWQERDHAEEVVLAEQTAVHGLLLTPNATPSDGFDADTFRMQLLTYVRAAQHESGSDLSESGERPMQLRCATDVGEFRDTAFVAFCAGQTLLRWEPTTAANHAKYMQARELFRTFIENRAHRIHHVLDPLPSVMWGSLIIGAVIIVAMTFLFDERWSRSQAFRTAALSSLIGIMLAEALWFDHPFSGREPIGREGWALVLCRFHQFDTPALNPGMVEGSPIEDLRKVEGCK